MYVTYRYDLAVVDVCRIAFAYHWVRSNATPQVLAARGEKTPLAPCAYNKNVEVARLMVRRCDEKLGK